jgi:hypothetical protein
MHRHGIVRVFQISCTEWLEVFASYLRSPAGRNTHAIDRALTIGTSWNFGGERLPSLAASASDSDEADRQLGKCLCTK